MKATRLYRIAGVLLLLSAVGNTYGDLNFWHIAGAMPPVHVPLGHAGLSYAQAVFGLDLLCSLCVLFAAYLAWHLGTLARIAPQSIGAMGWLLFAYQLVGVSISFICLSGLVRIVFMILAVCLGWAAWLTTGSRAASAPCHQETLGSPAC
jgi:hypothetical protein